MPLFSSSFARRSLALLWGHTMPTGIMHWLGLRSITLAPEQIAIREGLRAGVSVGSVMVVAWALDIPLMAWSAFAAFWTCLVDPGGRLGFRFKSLLQFGVGGTLAAGVLSAAAGLGTVPVFVGLGACIFLCGLIRQRGPVPAQISVMVAIVSVVAVCYPQTPWGALQLAGMFAMGATWALAICILAWPVDPYAPRKQACAAILREQAHMIARLLETARPGRNTRSHYQATSAYRRDIRSRIEQSRAALELLATGGVGAQAYTTLGPVLEACDQIFVVTLAFEHAALASPPAPPARRIIKALAVALHRTAREVAAAELNPAFLDFNISFLNRAGQSGDDVFAKGALLCARTFSDLKDAWSTPQDTGLVHASPVAQRPSRRPTQVFVRHAIRLTLAVLVSYAIALACSLSYAYWAMMAVVVVVQPSINNTLPRAIERVAGSITGGIMAALMGLALPSWLLLLLVFPLSAVTIAFRSVNYTMCVMFMSQLFVVVTDLISNTHDWDVAFARMLNNSIGSIIALLACVLLWPGRRPQSLQTATVQAFEANIDYALLVLAPTKTGWDRINQARRNAGTQSSQAEILYHKACLEGFRRSDMLNTCGEILFLLRQLAGNTSVWWLEQAGTAAGTTAQHAHFHTRLAQRYAKAPQRFSPEDEGTLPAMLAFLKTVTVEEGADQPEPPPVVASATQPRTAPGLGA
ncbi:FUSC family protein [Acetobacter vaccinii]|uniref:FUSC family protein n=1 Tax=Acetobacter vaccinii TaxID=2592655 RepID=A0A5C1YM53_9PROT|nr:FUSC family protein [Acetobacter vaccinii]QEO17021.1 FUSC family protein [Acetobacter vaccinii]